jgi:hypothetical protein
LKNLYFAHSYSLRDTDIETQWMATLQTLFPDYNVVNPFIYENKLIEKFGGVEYYDKYKKEGLSEGFKAHAKAIVENDLWMVRNSELVVAFVENKRQIGTLYEIAYAISYTIPVIVVCEQPSPFFVTLVEWYPTLEALKKQKGVYCPVCETFYVILPENSLISLDVNNRVVGLYICGECRKKGGF